MKEILLVAVDLETIDPNLKISKGHIKREGVELLDIGSFYFFNEKTFFNCFTNAKEFEVFLEEIQIKYDVLVKLVFHNIRYDLPILSNLGFNYLKFLYSDTMLLVTLIRPNIPKGLLGLENLSNQYNLKHRKVSDEEMLEEMYEKNGNENFITISNLKSNLKYLKENYKDIYYNYLLYDLKSTLNLYIIIREKIKKISNMSKSDYQIGTLEEVLEIEESLIPYVQKWVETPILVDTEKLYKEFPEKWEKLHNEFIEQYEILLNPPTLELTKDCIFNWRIYLEDLKTIYSEYDFSPFLKHCSGVIDSLENDFTLKRLKSIKKDSLMQDKRKTSSKGFKVLFGLFFTNKSYKFFSESTNLVSFEKSIMEKLEKSLDNKESKFIFGYVSIANKLDKIKSSFINSYQEHIEKYGNLYAHVFSYKNGGSDDKDSSGGTVSGRFSQKNINLQQVSKDRGENKYFLPIRNLFIAPEGYSIIDIDWKAQEYCIFSHVSGNKDLIELYKNNPDADIHSYVAGLVFGVSETKQGKNSIDYSFGENSGYIEKEQRTKAKTFNFGLIYGMTLSTFANNMGVSKEEAQIVLDKILKVNPDFIPLYHKAIMSSTNKGYNSTVYGRISCNEFSFFKSPVFVNEFSSYAEFLTPGQQLDFISITQNFKGSISTVENVLRSNYKNNFDVFYQNIYDEIENIPVQRSLRCYENIYDNFYSGYTKDPLDKLLTLLKDKGYCEDVFNDEESTKKLILLLDIKYSCQMYKSSDYKKNILRDIRELKEMPLNSFKRLLPKGSMTSKDSYNNYMNYVSMWLVNFWVKSKYRFLKSEVNKICQGTGADILKRKLLEIERNNFYGFDARIFTSVHDEIVFFVKKEQVESFVEKYKEILTVKDLKVQINVDVTVYENCWGLNGKKY
jgi:DNA polymerase I-like protein with 3'-5' exonuclease and polymerase domains